ncbi:TRAP transporter large permease subunit, partial [Pseudomonas aeruginosa]
RGGPVDPGEEHPGDHVDVAEAAAADASALSTLLVPAMEKEGYSRRFVAGLTGPIIPPSIFMILYSSLTNTSVGELFLAGVIPGLLLA